jgi:hypothetical protein
LNCSTIRASLRRPSTSSAARRAAAAAGSITHPVVESALRHAGEIRQAHRRRQSALSNDDPI